jgi:hypothetical protein
LLREHVGYEDTHRLSIEIHNCARNCRPSGKEGEGVLVGALQSEREEETRDRAERGSAVRGSAQASVAPERMPSPD